MTIEQWIFEMPLQRLVYTIWASVCLIVETNPCNVISKVHCSMVILQKEMISTMFLRYLTYPKPHANLQHELF